MNKKHLLQVIFGILLICSCSDVLDTAAEINVLQQEEYAIPLEDALSSLEDFMKGTGMLLETKGGLSDYIENCFSVSTPATKGNYNNEDILYAVNFKDEGGYALLSADRRIPDDIIAITDTGSVSERDFAEPDFERIPSENDDLSESEFDEMVESGVLAIEQNPINYECLDYAIRQLETHRYDDPVKIGSPCDPSGPGGTPGGFNETFTWKVVKSVPRLMNTAWTQSTPENDLFNKYCPEVGLIWRSIAPAGCVCIAVSQIIAYHEYPRLTCDGLQIDYPEIKKIYNYDNRWNKGTAIGREMLARFCRNIGAWCNIRYNSIFNQSWGFAWPWDAEDCLKLFGYQNVSLNWYYNEYRVLQSLDNGCPVFMSAITKSFSGHAWVIDGYIQRNYVSDKGTVSESQTLVHCNWGWHGKCNGYFTSGIFHTDEAVIPDESMPQTEKERYWRAFNTITYDNPRQ